MLGVSKAEEVNPDCQCFGSSPWERCPEVLGGEEYTVSMTVMGLLHLWVNSTVTDFITFLMQHPEKQLLV